MNYFQAFISAINPFIYGNESDVPVNSTVLHVQLTTCKLDVNDTTEPETVGGGSLEAPIDMTVFPDPAPPPETFTNITPTHPDRMVFSGLLSSY